MVGTLDEGAARELERLQIAFEATGDGLWDLDLVTGKLWISPQLRTLIGGEPTGLLAEQSQVRDRVHPDDLAAVAAATDPMLAGKTRRFALDMRLWHLGGYWTWVTVRGTVLAHDGDGSPVRVVGTLKDINARKQLEIQNEVLLKLSDALLRQGDAGSVLQGALDVLGAHFRPSRICFADIDEEQGTMTIRHEWSDGTVPSTLGTFPLADFEQGKEEQVRRGETVSIPDVRDDPRTAHPHILEAYAPYCVRAVLVLPMIRNGRFEAILFLHNSTPRQWTADEIRLAEQARTRIWDAVIREQAEARLRESERQFASIFELTPTIPWVVDADGNPVMLGASYSRLTGLTAEAVANDGWAETVHAEDRDEAVRVIVGCRASGEPMDVRYRMRQADGAYRWVRVQGAPRRDADGRILQWVGYIADIHQQVEAELALRKSEADARASASLLDQVLETTPDAIWAIDRRGRYLMANSATSRIVGESREAIIGRLVTDLLPQEFQAESGGQIERINGGAEVRVEETLFDRSHGAARVYDSRKVPLRGPNGEIRGVVGISRDITGRKATDEALRVSEEKARSSALLLQRILEATPASIWVLDRDGRYLLINAESGRILGIDNEAAVGKTLEDVLSADHARVVRGELEQVLRGEEIIVEEQLFDVARGEVRVFDSRKVPLRDAEGQIIGLVGVARDITERKAIELRLQAIVDTAVDAIVVIDERGCIASANPATFTLFGYAEAEMVGRNVAMIMPPGDAGAHDRYIDHYMQTGQRRIIGVGRQVMGLRKNGTSFPLDLSIAEWFDTNGKRHFTGIMRDVTARLEADARLRRAQDTLISVSRLSAAGAMASTLAHELNQPLTASSNLLRSARRMLERGEETGMVPGLLAEAATEVLRAGSIIRRMREYTVNGELEPAPHRLADLARTALSMVQRRSGADMVVEWALDPAVDKVMADPVQIEQVIANLLRNALEAMDGTPQRRIVIETEGGDGLAALHVHDSGHGIPPEQMDRLFQPFATTKDSGTGLGLAICRTIVEAHGGQILAANRQDGPGATFTITLPVARKARSRRTEVSA